jgi:hypothetical protein
LSSSKKLVIAVPDDQSNFCQFEHCGQAFVPMELLCKALEKAPYLSPQDYLFYSIFQQMQ